MADNYISTNMDTGLQVKEALNKINSHHPSLFVWIEIADTETIDLKSPTSNSAIKDPGDYVIYSYTNGPSEIPSTVSPVLLSIRDGKIVVSVNGSFYTLDSSGSSWINASEIADDSIIMYIKSDTAPTRTNNTFWFDTSNFGDSTDSYIDLKYYDTNSNSWVSVFADPDKTTYLRRSELDPTKKELDIYQYIMDKIAEASGDYAEFIKHKHNELTLIHITADEKNQYAKIINESELQELITNTYTPIVENAINKTITEIGAGDASKAISNLETAYNEHLANHVTADIIAAWDNKADSDHTHDYTTGDTKLQGSQIVSGIIPADQLPDEIKERYYKISSTPEEEFSNTSITDDDRSSKYHNGNAFYYDINDNGKIVRTWYRIIDSSRIGTSDWANGVVDFTAKETDMSWDKVNGHPTTLAEFGIENSLYKKSDIDDKFNAYNLKNTNMNITLDKCEETVSYKYNSDFIWTTGNISNTSRRWRAVCYGDEKFVAVAYNKYFAYSTDGINWTEGTISSTGRAWWSVCYGNGKFVTVAYNTNYFAYSTDGITWTESTISSTSRNWQSVCYGNGVFMTVAGNSNYYAISTDGITWTENLISDTSRNWRSVCYGNNKFVAVASNNNYCAYYSIEDAVWTEKKISNTSRDWQSICYGNEKFIAVASGNYGENVYFAYSTDGITWTEGVMLSNSSASIINYRYSICYGGGMFVAVGYTEDDSSGTVVTDNNMSYSFDGINWISKSIGSGSIMWYSVCYGDNAFVATTYASNFFAYALSFLDSLSISKIGIQYKITDITDYTDTMTGTIPQIDCIILTTDDKIYKTTVNINSKYLKHDGTYYTTNDSKEPLGATMLKIALSDDETASSYFTNRFASDYSTMDANPNYSTSGCGICVTASSTAKTLTVTDPIDSSITLCTIEYSNSELKFIYNKPTMIKNIVDVGIGSTDKLNCISDTLNKFKIIAIKEYGGSYSANSDREWQSICYGNNKFVAVAGNNSNYFAYSTDGINWTEGTISDTSRYWGSVCYGNNKYVAVSGDNFAYSTNGINWTEVNNIGLNWQSVCYGNDKFVAVAYSTNYFAYSTDGINWTKGTISSTNKGWGSVCYGNDKFVAVAYNNYYYAYSTDGITWTEGTISNTSRQWWSVCYGNNKFVAVAYSSNYFAYSTDGINWTEGTISSTSRQWTSVCYGNGKFVAVAYQSNYFAYSTDGIAWKEVEMESSYKLNSICYSPDLDIFIAVGPSKIVTIKVPNKWESGTRSNFIIN